MNVILIHHVPLDEGQAQNSTQDIKPYLSLFETLDILKTFFIWYD